MGTAVAELWRAMPTHGGREPQPIPFPFSSLKHLAERLWVKSMETASAEIPRLDMQKLPRANITRHNLANA
eukprot:8651784-Lingulodinium_polyedra.AAC.1